MKKTYMLKYFISFFAIISYLNCSSQEQNTDSIYKSTYGIKLGIDFSKQIRMLTEPEYKGIVIIGDYRVLDKLTIWHKICRYLFVTDSRKNSNYASPS